MVQPCTVTLCSDCRIYRGEKKKKNSHANKQSWNCSSAVGLWCVRVIILLDMLAKNPWIQRRYLLWFHVWWKCRNIHCLKLQYLRPCHFGPICLIKNSHRPFIPTKGCTLHVEYWLSYYKNFHYLAFHWSDREMAWDTYKVLCWFTHSFSATLLFRSKY